MKVKWQVLEREIVMLLEVRGFEIFTDHDPETMTLNGPLINLIEGTFSIREFAKELQARLEKSS
jgi:hypothetical protein